MKKLQLTMDNINNRLTPLLNQGLQLVILAAALLAIILVYGWNTSRLNLVLTHITENYVQDVAHQMTNDISARLNSDLTALMLTADGIPFIRGGNATQESIERFLNRKVDLLNFDFLAILDKAGQVTAQGGDLVKSILAEADLQRAFEGESGVTHVGGKSLLFFTPIAANGQIDRVLVGVRTQDNVQNLIHPTSFDGKGMSCLIDCLGNVVIAPRDHSSFEQLADIMGQEENTEDSASITKMMSDIARHQDGIAKFTSVSGQKLIMCYHQLDIGDWTLLTLIPEDLVTSEIDDYVITAFVVIGSILVLVVLFLMLLLRLYRTYNRQLEQTAYTDPLTGGLNNAAFQARYRTLAEDMEPNTYAVVLFNIKGFKLINENFGISAGNDTIKYVYHALAGQMGPDEFVGRSESDHFFLCLRENDPDKIKERILQLEQAANAFGSYTDIPYTIPFLQGVYLVDDPSLEVTIIQDRARAACQARRLSNQPGCAFYTEEMAREMQMEQDLDLLFESSLENRDFKVYLQPKICLKDGALGGAEALVRWVHPVRGFISPAEFIPLLEKNGKICQLDLYVFEEVCALQKRWREEGKESLLISVNLSRQHFKNLNFLQQFNQIAERYGILPRTIEFELTESIFTEDHQIDAIKYGMREMHDHGFLCSLDDFGSGFSSLGMLKAFDVDMIKLDRRFFDDMENKKTVNIITCLTELAKKLQVQTVAEGIETPEQLEYLRRVNCDMVQGYIFSRPLPIEEFEQWREAR